MSGPPAALVEAAGAALGARVVGGHSVDGPRLLALEWIDRGRLDGAGEEALGRGLAALHAAGAPTFGDFGAGDEPQPLRIGPIELPNDPAASWAELYARHRLLPLAERAAEHGALPEIDLAMLRLFGGPGECCFAAYAEAAPAVAGPAPPAQSWSWPRLCQ